MHCGASVRELYGGSHYFHAVSCPLSHDPTFPSNVYSSTVVQVPYYTTHAQCMLHLHISREGASNDVKVLRTIVWCISVSFSHLQAPHITTVSFPVLPTFNICLWNWRREMPGEEARVSNVCLCSLTNVAWYVLILRLLVA